MTALTRPWRLDLDSFASAAALHPEMVRRFIQMGLLEGDVDMAGRIWLYPSDLSTVARLQRLRAGFGLNYAALDLVVDLLDRISRLEAALRQTTRPGGGGRWTSIG